MGNRTYLETVCRAGLPMNRDAIEIYFFRYYQEDVEATDTEEASHSLGVQAACIGGGDGADLEWYDIQPAEAVRPTLRLEGFIEGRAFQDAIAELDRPLVRRVMALENWQMEMRTAISAILERMTTEMYEDGDSASSPDRADAAKDPRGSVEQAGEIRG